MSVNVTHEFIRNHPELRDDPRYRYAFNRYYNYLRELENEYKLYEFNRRQEIERLREQYGRYSRQVQRLAPERRTIRDFVVDDDDYRELRNLRRRDARKRAREEEEERNRREAMEWLRAIRVRRERERNRQQQQQLRRVSSDPEILLTDRDEYSTSERGRGGVRVLIHRMLDAVIPDFVDRVNNQQPVFHTINQFLDGNVIGSNNTLFGELRNRVGTMLTSLRQLRTGGRRVRANAVRLRLVPHIALAILNDRAQIATKSDGTLDIQYRHINVSEHDIIISSIEDFNERLSDYADRLNRLIESDMEEKNYDRSGVVVAGIQKMTMKLTASYNPGGARYFKIPDKYNKQTGIINPQNNDNKCLLWCILFYMIIKEKGKGMSKSLAKYPKFAKHRDALKEQIEDKIEAYCKEHGLELPNYENVMPYLNTIANALEVDIFIFVQDYNFDAQDEELPDRYNQRKLYRSMTNFKDVVPIYLVKEGEWLPEGHPSKPSEPRYHYCLINRMGRFLSEVAVSNKGTKKDRKTRSICLKCGKIFTGTESREAVAKTNKRKADGTQAKGLTAKEQLEQHQRDYPNCYEDSRNIRCKNNLVFNTAKLGNSEYPVGIQKRLGHYVSAYKALPLVIYADFESLNVPVKKSNVPGFNAETMQVPYQSNFTASSLLCSEEQFSQHFCTTNTRVIIDGVVQEGSPEYASRVEIFDSNPDRLVNLTVLEMGRIRKHFLNTIWENRPYKYPKPTASEQEAHIMAEYCTFCGDIFTHYTKEDDDEYISSVFKSFEHCPFTGKYIGSACRTCSGHLRWDKSVHIYYHNLSGYDGKILNKYFDYEFIPKNSPGGYKEALDGYYGYYRLEDLFSLPDGTTDDYDVNIKALLPLNLKRFMKKAEDAYEEYKKDKKYKYGKDDVEDNGKEMNQYEFRRRLDYDQLQRVKESNPEKYGDAKGKSYVNVALKMYLDSLEDPNHELFKYFYYKLCKGGRDAIVDTTDGWKTFSLLPKHKFYDTYTHTNSSLEAFVQSINKTLKEEEDRLYKEECEEREGLTREEFGHPVFERVYKPFYDFLAERHPHLSSEEKYRFCQGKGTYPYDAMTTYSILYQDHLPTDITLYPGGDNPNEYERRKEQKSNYMKALSEWNRLRCENMRQFSSFYGMGDVLLLKCAFDYNREQYMDRFSLDPCMFMGTPAYALNYVLSELGKRNNYQTYERPEPYNMAIETRQMVIDNMRTYAECPNELIEARHVFLSLYYGSTLTSLPTQELQDFVSESIRGGYCSPTYKRIYVERDGYYMICLDVNSLYPSAMLEDLALCVKPVINSDATAISFFRQVENMDHFYELLSTGRNSQYQFELDLIIPDDIQESIDALPEQHRGELIKLKEKIDREFNGSLHEYLRGFPPIIESFTPTEDLLSPYNKRALAAEGKPSYKGTRKLVAHFLPVENYKVFTGILRYLVFNLGVKVLKVHRYLEYYSSSFLNGIINELYKLRDQYKRAKNEVMQQIVKLIMNSLYGKLLESLDNRSEYMIVDDLDQFLKETSADTFHDATMINEKFILISKKNIDVKATNTLHTGASVLDNSKLILLRHYYTLREQFGNRMTCYYTDTDSIFIEVPDSFLDECIESGLYKDVLQMSSFIKGYDSNKNVELLVPMKNKALFTDEVATANKSIPGVLALEGGVIVFASFVKSKSYAYRYDGGGKLTVHANQHGHRVPKDKVVFKHKGISRKSKIEDLDLDTLSDKAKKFLDQAEYSSLRYRIQVDKTNRDTYRKLLYYVECIVNVKEFKATSVGMRSHLFSIYRGNSTRIFLSPVCDKMYVCGDDPDDEEYGIELFPYGYQGKYMGSTISTEGTS